jgi:hypothetical protein
MVRYFYAWTPLGIVGTVAVLSLPWLGLIAIFLVPYLLVRAITRSWQGRSAASPRTAAVSSPATHQPTFRKGYVW